MDGRRNGVFAPVAKEPVPDVSGINGLNVHLAPLAKSSSGSVGYVAKDHRGKTQGGANQQGLPSAAGTERHAPAQQPCRNLARETRHQRTDLAEFGTCPYPTHFMNAGGRSFVLEKSFSLGRAALR